MRIAHIIMAYKNPNQIERLIKIMEHDKFDFYIHLDKKVSFKNFEYLKEISNVKFIEKRVLINWGGFSLINAVINSVSEVLNSETKYEFINLLSGQDYPIKSAGYIYEFYKANNGKCFISYDEPEETDWWKEAIDRVKKYHFNDYNFSGRYFLQRLMNKILPVRRIPLSYKLYGSNCSSWWTLTTSCAQYFIHFMKTHNKLSKFMKLTWAPDEFIYATIIKNSSFEKQVINNNLRYIDWTKGGAHPKILTTDDIAPLIQSDRLFARKFDTTVDVQVLNHIDSLILKHE